MDLTQLIVAEKMVAFMGAVASGTAGGSAYNVVKGYRRCVQAKARRMRFAWDQRRDVGHVLNASYPSKTRYFG
jgi:hypothetical protein